MRAKTDWGIRCVHVFILVVIVCAGSAFGATYGGGSGKAEDPYQIWTAEQLFEIGLNTIDYDKHFVLMGDVDLTGKSTTQAVIAKDTNNSEAGFQGTGFSGCFDGGGHVIRNMSIGLGMISWGYLI